jgi:hypothetical protein
VILINNDVIIKCKINNNLGTALKKILDKLNLSQQDFLEQQIEQFVLNNLILIIEDGKDKE